MLAQQYKKKDAKMQQKDYIIKSTDISLDRQALSASVI